VNRPRWEEGGDTACPIKISYDRGEKRRSRRANTDRLFHPKGKGEGRSSEEKEKRMG